MGSPSHSHNVPFGGLDDRSLGGKKVLVDMHFAHKRALQNAKSEVSKFFSRPHAHISNCQGSRTGFGLDKNHMKVYRSRPQSIHADRMREKMTNITPELYSNMKFAEVKYLKQKLPTCVNVVDNSKPKTYDLRKQLSKNRHKNQNDLVEHLMNIASMQRRMANLGDMRERAKNPTDPVAHPSLFFRRAGQSTRKTSIVGFKRKIMRRLNKQK